MSEAMVGGQSVIVIVTLGPGLGVNRTKEVVPRGGVIGVAGRSLCQFSPLRMLFI